MLENALFLGLLIGTIFGLGAAVLALRLRACNMHNPEPAPDPMVQKITETVEQMARAQSELTGRLDGMAAAQETARGELTRTMTEQLTQVSKTVADNLKDTGERTTRTLGDLGQRLSLIDKAQQEITALSGQVVELQHILDNKQARGAFGEAQLNDIVTDGLPESAYAFQHSLSNGKRADCLIRLPNPPGPVVVDSKFPLEAYRRLTSAANDAERDAAKRLLENDVKKHIQDIAEKYIIPGETAESAILFLPSESVYAEINIQLPKLVEASRKARVYMAGPDNLMLLLHTVRAILRDARMHEAAGLIQTQVDLMMKDVHRLEDRVVKLATHFSQAEKDISDIQTSTGKIISRGNKIDEIEVLDADEATPAAPKTDLLS